MNVISSTSSTDYLYELEKIQQAKALERIQAEKKQEQQDNDTVNISQQAIQALGTTTQSTSSSSPLDSLVSDGTITKDQASSVISAFQSIGNAVRTSGTYSNNIKQNPLESLVSAGIITQDQEKSIKSAFETAIE